MSAWLDPLRRVLDDSPRTADFFFRDDDGGWGDDRLFELLGLFERYDCPIDVAVIPSALTPVLASELRARAEVLSLLGLHQHGFAHANHEPEGSRKCEFGPSRSGEMQRRDIEAGRRRLEELFRMKLAPVFTPPWNRCTQETCDSLEELGFAAISRDASADPLDTRGLVELPVSFDWFAKRKGLRLSLEEAGALLADKVKESIEPVGLMFHHALMDEVEMKAVGELLSLLTEHGRACLHPMPALIEGRLRAQIN